jgi:sugar phosphate isomerase/epimerase
VAILADLGYDAVAWTPDVHHLDPSRSTDADVDAFGALLARRGLGVIVETGARFLLDPRRKHRPSLLDEPREAQVRVRFLRRCVDLAARLGAPVVSTWSGSAPDGLSPDEVLRRLAAGLREVCEHAASRGVRVGFEPEPGMAVERADAWPSVRDAVAHETLGLTLDVGHCLATREGAPEDAIRRHAGDLLVVQLDDHRAGTHDHLLFGEGDVDFPAVAAALREAGFSGFLEVELSRHSATAPESAARSLAFLHRIFMPTPAARRGPP